MNQATVLVLAAMILAGCSGSTGDTSTHDTTTTTLTGATSTAGEGTSTTLPQTSTTSTSVTQPDIVISGGDSKDSGLSIEGPDLFSFALGDQVLIRVRSSVTGELHVHGYDLHFDLLAGQVTTVEFAAQIPGIFEVEFEDTSQLVFEVEVTP